VLAVSDRMLLVTPPPPTPSGSPSTMTEELYLRRPRGPDRPAPSATGAIDGRPAAADGQDELRRRGTRPPPQLAPAPSRAAASVSPPDAGPEDSAGV
jgi:hypothetical protein